MYTMCTFCGYVQLMDTLAFHSAVTVQFSANIWPCNVWTKPVLFKYTSRILFTAREENMHFLNSNVLPLYLLSKS